MLEGASEGDNFPEVLLHVPDSLDAGKTPLAAPGRTSGEQVQRMLVQEDRNIGDLVLLHVPVLSPGFDEFLEVAVGAGNAIQWGYRAIAKLGKRPRPERSNLRVCRGVFREISGQFDPLSQYRFSGNSLKTH